MAGKATAVASLRLPVIGRGVLCRRELVRTRVSSPAWSLCCESCVQCGPTVYSATRRACGRVEGNFWLLYHLANVRTLTRYTPWVQTQVPARSRLCADCSESRTLALFRSAQHTPAEHW